MACINNRENKGVLMKRRNRIAAALLAAAMCITPMAAQGGYDFSVPVTITASAESISDMPAEFQYAADWIWTNRIEREPVSYTHLTLPTTYSV